LPEELNVPNLTDREYLWTHAPFYPRFDHELFGHYAREFELPQNRRLTTLSYGQKKKFLLSFGLACGSSLLVLDEPTNGLDIPSKGQFRRLIAGALNKDRVFVISTHQVRDVESLIDPIVILHAGAVLFNQSVDNITSRIRMLHTPTQPAPETAGLVYSEPALGGFWSVWNDGGDGDGQLDLEILFNTVIANAALYASLFETQEVAA
jgi:ABC-2 type transport system ATP-binding protein